MKKRALMTPGVISANKAVLNAAPGCWSVARGLVG